MKARNIVLMTVLIGTMPFFVLGNASAQSKSQHEMMHGIKAPNGKKQHDANKMHHSVHGALDQHLDAKPLLPGQDAFGAIKEIVSILEADPSTDWSSINISKLRNHLVDMNHLVINANVLEKSKEGGLEMTITGKGRALQAIKAMVPAHASMIEGINGWIVKVEVSDDGAKLTVTATDDREAAHIRGLGFYGIMVSGSHHQVHHLSLARGKNMHSH